MNTSNLPTQRSQRVSASKSTTTKSYPTLPVASGGSQMNSHSEDQPLQKRRKTTESNATKFKSTTTCRSRPGKLQELPNMPLDILFEIFEHLLPLDILRLSRTSKDLRRIILPAKSIWRITYSNLPIPPPPCPEDLTEPQWASLLFETNCSVGLSRCIH